MTEDFRRKLRALRGLCQDIVELRRGDHSGVRLKLEQERLDRERERTEEEVVAHFQGWVRTPQVRDLICEDGISPEEKVRRMRALFGLAPKPPPGEKETSAVSESNPVKPSQTESGPTDRPRPNPPA